MNPVRKVNLGLRLLRSGQPQEAARISAELLATAPDVAQVQFLACEVAMAQDRTVEALGHIERAAELDGQEPEFLLRRAGIQVIQRRGIEAQKTAAEVAGRFPENVHVQLSAAQIFSDCGNHVGAEPLLMAAGALEPHNPTYLFRWSNNQFFLGKTEATEKAIADYLALGLQVNGRKLLLRSRLHRQTFEDNHVEALRKYLQRPLPKKEAVNVYFALAKELEDLGEFAQSFDALRAGATLQRQLVDYDLTGEIANIDAIIEAFQPGSFAAVADSAAEDTPVFIVGLPRTGTTLVERIVTRHAGVRSAEETYDFTLAFSSVINEYLAANRDAGLTPLSAALAVDYGEIARRYLDSMRGMLGPADSYLDKTPFNFLYCGLIRKAFPRARIIHLVRDPMDSCYAVFKALFDKAYFWSYDLDELADYYIVYRRLMDHWHRLMPGAILDVSYEELVTNPREVTQRIADYVGLDWSEEMVEIQNATEPSATASAAQVRQPIYTSSVGLWRNVAAELEPLRMKLAAAGLVDENGVACSQPAAHSGNQ